MSNLSRRQVLQAGAITMATMAAMPWFSPFASAQERKETSDGKRKKILFFTKSSGFEHSVVKRHGGAPAYAERVLTEFAGKAGFDIEASKDGTLFDGDLSGYDAFFFYTTGDLTQVGTDGQPAMSAKGKQRLLEAVASGKGFIGSHCASDTFHTPGKAFANQAERDPYIAMLGGEFIRHGRQQSAYMRTVDRKFPGTEKAGEGFNLNEEWYSLKNFAPDLHVILVQETKGMQDFDYDRPPYPATWARMHQKGRVFYTSMGHREDVWTNPIFQELVAGALRWTTGLVDADVTPNLQEVTPEASTLPKVD